MRIVGYRLDDARAKKLDKLFSQYGFNSDTASKNHTDLLDLLFDLTANGINSQKIAKGLSERDKTQPNEKCNLLIKTKQIVRVLDANSELAYEYQDVFYCLQWEKGKVKRQLKIISEETCKICQLLKAAWLEEQPDPADPAAQEAPEQPPPTPLLTMPPSPPQQPRPESIPNSFECERNHVTVHYTVCFECRATTSGVYYNCLRANPEIAKALDYWKKISPTGKMK